MPDAFPSPTYPAPSRADVLLRYLDYFRSVVVDRITGLDEPARHAATLPSGWTPLELVRHLTFVEHRWLEWGFEGHAVEDPWGDQRDGRWFVPEGVTTAALLAGLAAQAARTRTVVERHDLSAVGRPGPRWEGAEPATLERVMLHLVQEYARHVGHLDVVAELAGGPVGE